MFISESGSLILGRTHKLVRTESDAKLYFDMSSYAQQVVTFYCDLCGVSESSLKSVPSPALPESTMSDEEAEQWGVLHNDAAKALMRLLWLSRLSRPDLSFIVCRLASNVSRWSRWGDRQLHRVICYLKSTLNYCCCGSISYGHQPVVHAYSDADFASCPWSAKSTTGIMLGIRTGEAFFPLLWQSRKQSSIARSTPEAEIIAFAAVLYGEALHIQETLQYLFEQDVSVKLEQDNEAVIKIIQNRYSARLRHCNRVHRVNIASICETLEKESELRYCKSDQQLANSFTKILAPVHWPEALRQMCITQLPTT